MTEGRAMETRTEERPDRLTFLSYDGQTEARMGQGDRCVFITIQGEWIVLTDDEAEAMGRSLIRRARYSRAATPEADNDEA